MESAQVISLVSVLMTLAAGFGGIMLKLGRLELKIDTVWQWFIQHTGAPLIGGTRTSDPNAPKHH